MRPFRERTDLVWWNVPAEPVPRRESVELPTLNRREAVLLRPLSEPTQHVRRLECGIPLGADPQLSDERTVLGMPERCQPRGDGLVKMRQSLAYPHLLFNNEVDSRAIRMTLSGGTQRGKGECDEAEVVGFKVERCDTWRVRRDHFDPLESPSEASRIDTNSNWIQAPNAEDHPHRLLDLLITVPLRQSVPPAPCPTPDFGHVKIWDRGRTTEDSLLPSGNEIGPPVGLWPD